MEIQSARKKIRFGPVESSNRALWISLGLGLVAAIANMIYVSNVDGSRLTVMKARSRLTAGRIVSAGDFTPIRIFGDDLKEMKALVVEAKDFNVFAGVPLAETLEPGQVLMQSSFTFTGNRGIRDAIDKNHRAIALEVKDDASAVNYLVRPGDVVDAWVNDGSEMQNVLSEAVVKAVGDSTFAASESGGRDFRYRTVTVIVPKDAVPDILVKLEGSKNGSVVLALAGSGSQ